MEEILTKSQRKNARERDRVASLTEADRKIYLEKRRRRQREWYAANIENQRARCREQGREYRKLDLEKEKAKKRKYLYGLTEEQYQAILQSQGGVCAICNGVSSGRYRNSLVVDHDHCTGTVRGLLCYKCNSAIGFLNDDPALISKAIGYLGKEREGGAE
jgi:hypothetical protein